ncbi:MAG: phosphoribosyl-ATP diphosphatase [Acidobacteriota bacterium]
MSLEVKGWDDKAQQVVVFQPAELRYSVPPVEDGPPLLTVIAQDAYSGAILMVGYADQVAVERTLSSETAWFWSRSRRQLWQKGESSGNVLQVLSAQVDCDVDALLLRVVPAGPTCHRGTRSCFMPSPLSLELGWLYEVLRQRVTASPEGSYTARLLAKGPSRVAQKVGEEGVETVIAALNPALENPGPGAEGEEARRQAVQELVGEASDLVYHLLVLLLARGVEPGELAQELGRRHAQRKQETS